MYTYVYEYLNVYAASENEPIFKKIKEAIVCSRALWNKINLIRLEAFLRQKCAKIKIW